MRLVRNVLIAVALSAAPISSAVCQQIAPPNIEWVQAGTIVPFTLYRENRVVAPGTINGKAVEFILDTGASVTTLDKSYARSIGIAEGQKVEATGSGGKSEAEIVTGITLTIGGLKLTNVTAAVIDLSEIEAAIGRPMNVILGRELFDHAALGIDWQSNTLSVQRPVGFKPPRTAKEVKLGRTGPFNSIAVSVEGLKPVEALLDLGNGGTLTLPARTWESEPKLAGLRYAESRSGGVGGLHGARAVTLGSVDYGGIKFWAVPATLTSSSRIGAEDRPNAGIGFLRQFRVTLDLGNDRMFLEPLANQPEFLRDRSGLRTRMVDGKLTVSFVSPNSPGAAAGIKEGDQILAINGEAVDPDFYSGAMANWAHSPSGEKVELKMASGSTVNVTLADYF